uniref:NADH-ubiquinone oxidoreductase chain 5 n=2 Tax=Pseudothericles compressifrons TaxID=1564105 RepID=A0A0N6WAE6_9ORTH|nr:NADH dehydrogenase subunit 5 [Pseudothericles compressifrons]AJW76363.1 NADH dehydrogenase subunit 5 [Pseudothericles compressifrons]
MKLFSICSLSYYFLFMISLGLLIFGVYFTLNDLVYFVELELITLNSSSFVMTLLFDWMSLLFMSFVLFISSLVIYYSTDYMSGESNLNRFIILVLMFVLSMMFLIISPNLVSILLGWDGLGLVSYCLVIYYQNYKSYNAGMLTVMSNRIGDVAILLSIAWMLNHGGWNYIYYYDFFNSSFEMHVIMMLIILAAMTSSAQIPFSSWLPAAMAAPTPVSALVHSSTLVTAGVYLMIRFNPILVSSGFSIFLLIIGCLTMFMAGLGANYEYDLKKIIALSTLSQLGLMMSILSMGFYKLAFFHLLTHALFKALLFMCAGSYIHVLKDFQDIRYMGLLVNYMPFTSICFNVSSLCLCGMPFLSGFYSKDLILEMVGMSWVNILIFFLYFFSTGLTAMYSFRLFYYSMTSNYNYLSSYSFHDDSFYMNSGMLLLMVAAVFGGSMLGWLVFPYPYVVILPIYLKLMTMIVVMVGLYFGYYVFSSLNMNSNNISLYLISSFLGSMWFMPFLSTSFLSFFPLKLGYYSSSIMDYGWLEMMGGQGLYNLFIYFLNYMQNMFDSNFKIYLLSFVMWMFVLFSLYFI